ncbi:hypothetical protein HF086_005216 [Spodoptera exigua]|uniref:Glucosylceramidase n=1 Tax=Spodoptera exigua TaxID=7107 RepID=A0A922MZ45_SPOEX|nr:hypothetical protein HF086_005216 [Spodoptera exigua]
MAPYKVCVLFGILAVCFFGACLAARKITGKSVVCVCNATYCDTISREPFVPNTYVVYSSSQSGLRFSKNRAELKQANYSGEIK